MTDRKIDEREAFIAKAVDRAGRELAEIRARGGDVCDIAYIEGTMIEAAKEYDALKKTTT